MSSVLTTLLRGSFLIDRVRSSLLAALVLCHRQGLDISYAYLDLLFSSLLLHSHLTLWVCVAALLKSDTNSGRIWVLRNFWDLLLFVREQSEGTNLYSCLSLTREVVSLPEPCFDDIQFFIRGVAFLDFGAASRCYVFQVLGLVRFTLFIILSLIIWG